MWLASLPPESQAWLNRRRSDGGNGSQSDRQMSSLLEVLNNVPLLLKALKAAPI
jgi:hypothetical protein